MHDVLALAHGARHHEKVKGRTLDNLTGENIGDVTLVLMNADSIPIDTMVSIGPPNHPILVGMFAF